MEGRYRIAVTAFCAAVFLSGAGGAAEPFELIERVYAEADHDDNPPGGAEVWSTEIIALWKDMLKRREDTDRAPSILPPGAPGSIDMTLEIETSHEATVRVDYAHQPGYAPLEVRFGFVRDDNDNWKIMEIWRESRDGEMMYLSDLLKSLFCDEAAC